MKQITEDYVSFETAVLLKEKGFDGLCTAYYDCFTTDNFHCGNEPKDFNSIDTKIRKIVAAPTHQLALKWLREVHKMYIYIKPLEDGNCFSAHLLYNGIDKLIEGGAWGSYESACEAALLYVLKKLI